MLARTFLTAATEYATVPPVMKV